MVPQLLAQVLLGDALLLHVKVEEVGVETRCAGLIVGVVVGGKVRVLQALLDREAVARVEGERLLQKVDRLGRSLGEQGAEVSSLAQGHGANVVTRATAVDVVELLERRRAENIEDQRELLMIVAAREERAAGEHLGQDASDGPHIDRLGVLLEGEHDLGRAIPPGSDVLGHEARVLIGSEHGASQSEVAHFEVAVGIEQDVARLEVAMNDVGAVHGLERTQSLVGEVLAVVVRELLGTDNAMKVSLHELLDEVHLGEGLVGAGLDDVEDADDVLRDIALLKEAQQLELTQRSQRKHLVLEWLDLLDGHLLTRGAVDGAADDTVGAFADDLADLVLAADAEADGVFVFVVSRGGLRSAGGGGGDSSIRVCVRRSRRLRNGWLRRLRRTMRQLFLRIV